MSVTNSPAQIRTTSPPSPTMVMLWDPAAERFAPMTLESHSSTSHNSGKPLPPSPLPLKRSSSLSHSRRRLSQPDSVLDFGEFLKELDREIPQSPTSGWAASRPSTAPDEYQTSKIVPPAAGLQQQSTRGITAPSWKPTKVLKTALKEVLGGGGNYKRMPKDPTVSLPFGRGGAAVRVKAVADTKQSKPDPYLAHGSSISPSSEPHLRFPPNANLPVITRRESRTRDLDEQHPQSSVSPELYTHLPPDWPYLSHAGYHCPTGYYDRPEYQPRVRRDRSLSTSSRSASEGKHGDESVTFCAQNQQALPKSSPVSWRPSRATMHRQRASSVDSALALPTVANGPSILVHPEQAAMEAAMDGQKRQRETRRASKDVSTVYVRAVSEVDAIPVADIHLDDDNDDAMSLSSFPAPPSILHSLKAPARGPTRTSSLPTEMPSHPDPNGTNIIINYSQSRGLGVQPRTWLPTIPAPGPVRSGSSPKGSPLTARPATRYWNSNHPTNALHLPPAPLIPAPMLPRTPRLSQPLAQHTNGNRRANGSPPGEYNPSSPTDSSEARQTRVLTTAQPAIRTESIVPSTPAFQITTTTSYVGDDDYNEPSTSVFSLMYSESDTCSVAELQFPVDEADGVDGVTEQRELVLRHQADALAKQREMLEDQVRGLIWFANSFEVEQQRLLPESTGLPLSSLSTPRGGCHPPAQMVRAHEEHHDERSSTSTERAVSYLSYAR
ncbi:hypothetical protein FRB96_001689 [Tulasnella sp. 330]|nr:hypothetical protein FRB96_001689 [Tulasnella sp. 330]